MPPADLVHVDLATAVPRRRRSRAFPTVVVAKHLCSADLPRPQVAPELFSKEEFALLTRWSSPSALWHRTGASVARTEARDAPGKYAPGAKEDGSERHPNAFAVAAQLGLSCAGSGLGRAIQRIIDFGRCD